MKQAKIGCYLKRKAPSNSDNICEDSSKRNVSNDSPQESTPISKTDTPSSSLPIKIDLETLPMDPVDRPRTFDYDPNQREEIRRLYYDRGPCRPRGHVFPSRSIGGKVRRFVVSWFDEFDWWKDAFVIKGFDSWHKKAYLYAHVGNVDSYHNRAFQKCENLWKENQSIADAFNKKNEIEKVRYMIRLNATIYCVRLCLKTENPMHGHDESETSLFKGKFLEVYHFLRDHNEAIRAFTLENAPKNCTLTSPKIQKDVVNCFAKEIVKSICLEIGADVFSLLVDESSDVSKKEQMAIVLRYVDKYGILKERFVGIVQVKDTSSSTLKDGIDSLFNKHGLSLKQLRGQGYDGASNMRGEFNGLKALILKENESAYYIHCFAHQLQLVVVAVAKNHDGVGNFFDILSAVTNVKDQTILEAVSLVKGTIGALKQTRASGFPSLLNNVTLFCELHGIEMVNMAESHSKSRRNKITNQHHFEVDIFNTVLDMQIQEFGDRFSELSTELLENMAALSPHNSFCDFNVSKLVKLCEMYPRDFTYMERLRLPTDLAVYYQIMSNDKDFAELSSISRLASLMVEKNKHTSHPLVYRLLKLALILPVATATVERCFSKMKLVKTDLRNRMGEEYFNGSLICAIEKQELLNVTNEVIHKRFFADFLRLYPDGQEDIDYLRAAGLQFKVNYSVNPFVLSEVQAATSGLRFKDIHLNHPRLQSAKEEDDENTHKATGEVYMHLFFRMCATLLRDEGTVRLICSKSVFENWMVRRKALDNNFILDDKWRLDAGHCPPAERIEDGIVCHFTKIRQIQSQQISGPISATSGQSSGDHAAAITFFIKEYLTACLDQNGVGEFVVSGILKMEVKNPKHGFFKFQVESETPDIKFKAHNKIDERLFSSDMILGLKSPNSPFEKTSGPLRWKLETKDVSLLPLRINCQTSVYGNELHVKVDYTASERFILRDVDIKVPLPPLCEAMNVELVHGDWSYDSENSQLEWSIRCIDNSNPSGSMKFVVRGAADVSDCFPISLEFSSTSTFSKLKILRIIPVKKGAAPKFTHMSKLVTETYEVTYD